MISNNETDFLPNLLLIDKHVSSLTKVFTNYFTVNVELSKIKLYKIIHSG